MEKRILIKEDRERFKEIAKDLKQFMPVLNELKSSFEALQISEFTDEDFKKIVLLGHNYHIDKYVKNLNNQLDKAGITIQIIRQNAIKDHENVIERFKKAIDNAKRFQPEIYSANRAKLTLKFISFQGGLFIISKEDKEMILESFCRTYLENEEEIKFYEIVENLKESFNKYLDVYNTLGVPNSNSFLTITNIFKVDENRKFVIIPGNVKSLFSYKRRREEYDSMRVK